MILHGIRDADYRAMAGFSGTQCAAILESPAKFKRGERKETAAMSLGTIIHSIVLGGGADIAVSPYADFRTDEAKAWRDSMLVAGMTVVKQADLDAAQRAADAVMAHPEAGALIRAGQHEVTLTWEAHGIQCKGRIDNLVGPRGADLKSATDATEREFASDIARRGYHIQQGHYANGLAANGIEPDPSLFIVVETAPPFEVVVYEMPLHLAEFGRQLADGAVKRYRDCMEADVWPSSLPDEIVKLDIPAWGYRHWEALV